MEEEDEEVGGRGVREHREEGECASGEYEKQRGDLGEELMCVCGCG